MNENIDLTQILKDCPEGTKLWHTVYGEVKFTEIDNTVQYPIILEIWGGYRRGVSKEGKFYKEHNGECVLFPSKDQRDWSKFKAPNKKVKVTLHPFDKALARDVSDGIWAACFVEGGFKQVGCCNRRYVIPYNKDTAHLLGTSDKPEIEYEIEFSKELKE